MKSKTLILLFILAIAAVSFTGCSGTRKLCPAYSDALQESSEDESQNNESLYSG